MASAALPIAVSSNAPCVGDPQPALGRDERRSTILPAWANTAQGRALITAIKAEQPARTVDDACGFKTVRYLGRNAAQLRALFDRTMQAMIAWVEAARVPKAPGRPMPADHAARYEQRREAVIEWGKEFGPDALIARTLGEAL